MACVWLVNLFKGVCQMTETELSVIMQANFGFAFHLIVMQKLCFEQINRSIMNNHQTMLEQFYCLIFNKKMGICQHRFLEYEQ